MVSTIAKWWFILQFPPGHFFLFKVHIYSLPSGLWADDWQVQWLCRKSTLLQAEEKAKENWTHWLCVQIADERLACHSSQTATEKERSCVWLVCWELAGYRSGLGCEWGAEEEELEEIHMFIKTIKNLAQLLMSVRPCSDLHYILTLWKGQTSMLIVSSWQFGSCACRCLSCSENPSLFSVARGLPGEGGGGKGQREQNRCIPSCGVNIIESQNLSLSQRAGVRRGFLGGHGGIQRAGTWMPASLSFSYSPTSSWCPYPNCFWTAFEAS